MKKYLLPISIILTALLLVFAGCDKNGPDQPSDKTPEPEMTQAIVDGAAEMLYEYNKPGLDNSVSASFKMPAKIIDYSGFDFDVEWKLDGGNDLVSIEQSGSDLINVNVNPFADEDTEFKLTATVKGGSFKKDVEFNYTIKGFKIATWEYWAENTKDVTMNIKGIVVAKYPYSAANANVGVFLQDLDGQHGYFCYRMKCESQEACDTDLAIGNIIVVSGKTSIYNGFREMGQGCTYTVVKDADGKIQTGEVKKIAIDEYIGQNGIDAKLDPLQGMIATISDAQIKKFEWNSNDASTYYEKGAGSVYITLTKNGGDFRIYLSTSNQLTLDQLKAEYEKLGVGYVVDVEGPISWYNTAQLYPCAGGITVKSTEVSDEDKVNTELEALSLVKVVRKNTEIALPIAGTSYENVIFSWDVHGDASVETGNAKFTVGDKAQVVYLEVTATCGTYSGTKEFAVRLIPENISQAELVDVIYTLEDNETLDEEFRLEGTVKSIDTEYSEQYKNVTVTIVVEGKEDKPVQCFRLTGDGCESIKVGDSIVVKGTFKNYRGTYEFNSGCKFLGLSGSEIPEDDPGDAKAILDKLYALKDTEKLDGEFTLQGVITKIVTPYNDSYKDITVEIVVGGDTNRPVQCYQLKGTGVDTLKAGYTITVKGSLKNYKGTFEFDKDCQLVSIDDKTESGPKTNYANAEEIVTALYALKDKETIDDKYTLSGTIKEIPTAYNDQYKNVTVVIIVDGIENAEGRPVTCYRLKGDGADALKVGDHITVTGTFKNYQGTFEFAEGCTFTK